MDGPVWMVCTVLVVQLLLLSCVHHVQGASGSSQLSFRELFQRVPGSRLSSRVALHVPRSTVEQCAQACVQQTDFLCKSFDINSVEQNCDLYNVSLDDPDVHLIETEDVDHYQTAYEKQYVRLVDHKLTDRHTYRKERISVEGCARLCALHTHVKCQGFDYEVDRRNCWLTDFTSDRIGGPRAVDGWDYYSVAPVGVLSRFLNYGTGQLKVLSKPVYDQSVMSVSLATCADTCLSQTTFRCVSFDYTYNGPDHSTCRMSKYLAANVYGLQRNSNHRTIHYEIIEPHMNAFYTTPYTLLSSRARKTYELVTPNLCAQKCLREEQFVCRSFDYMTDRGKCNLNTLTGSDVGGLFPQTERQIHHFEMKPVLECGGNYTEEQGDFASPGWPRAYTHNEECVWRIHVPSYKVIEFTFTHFDLAVVDNDPCGERSDRVIVSEYTAGRSTEFCVLPNTKKFTTRSNNVTVTFRSNSFNDAQGFRAFYSAEWTCDVHLHSASGEIASTGYPAKYTSSTTCSWRITAPPMYRVRVNFDHFDLEQNALGHCNERHDRVILLDGGTVSSPLIGLYCGVHHEAFSVRSTGRDIFIQFQSDADTVATGFHARYVYESHNGTTYASSHHDLDRDGVIIPLDGTTGEDITDTSMVYSSNGMLIASAKKHMQTDHSGPGLSVGTIDLGYPPIDSSYHSTLSDGYRTTMWAVCSVLGFLLVAALIAVVLVWRHYKRQLDKLRAQRSRPTDDLLAEEVPLQDTRRLYKQCNNEVTLPPLPAKPPVGRRSLGGVAVASGIDGGALCGGSPGDVPPGGAIDDNVGLSGAGDRCGAAEPHYTPSPTSMYSDRTDKDNRINERNVNNLHHSCSSC